MTGREGDKQGAPADLVILLQVHGLGKVPHEARRPGQLEIANPLRQVLCLPAVRLRDQRQARARARGIAHL